MTEEQRAQFWELLDSVRNQRAGASADTVRYVSQLVHDAWKNGHELGRRKSEDEVGADLRAMCEAWQSEDANTCNAIAGRVLGNEQVTT